MTSESEPKEPNLKEIAEESPELYWLITIDEKEKRTTDPEEKEKLNELSRRFEAWLQLIGLYE